MSFRQLEESIWDALERTVNRSGGDFDPARDVEYGPVAAQPQVRDRRPFRNVWIANSDSGAFAYRHSAINDAAG